jgi:outer membrane biosynthesis protein TonB
MMPTTTNDAGLKNSLAFSAGFHLFLLLLLYFGMPILFKPTPVYHLPVPFEIVEIADITNTRVKETPEPPKPPEPPPQPAQKALAPQSVPSPPAPSPTPPPPKPMEKVTEALLPKPVEKKPLEKPKPVTDAAFASLLKNLTKSKPQAIAKPTPDTQPQTKPQQEASSQAPSLSSRLTMTEEDALRRQMRECWNMPIGARDAQDLIVEVKMIVNPDRAVQTAEVVDKTRMATDPFYRAAAEAALRALNNPKCIPLELPPDKYDEWKNLTLTFSPKDML